MLPETRLFATLEKERKKEMDSLLKGKPVSFPAPGVVVTIQVFRLPCSDPGKAIARICNELLV